MFHNHSHIHTYIILSMFDLLICEIGISTSSREKVIPIMFKTIILLRSVFYEPCLYYETWTGNQYHMPYNSKVHLYSVTQWMGSKQL